MNIGTVVTYCTNIIHVINLNAQYNIQSDENIVLQK